MKKIVLASALVLALVIVALTFLQPPLNNTADAPCEDALHCIGVSTIGSGTVTSSPSGITCPPTCSWFRYTLQTWVTLTATPSEGWVCTGWNSPDGSPLAGCSGTGPCHISVGNGSYWTATFRRQLGRRRRT